MKIVTGKKYHAVGSSKPSESRMSAVLFDSTSTKTVSHFIHIEPGQVFKFSTFNLPDEAKLTFHRVYTGGGVMPHSSGCLCGAEDSESVKVLASEVFKIDCWPVYLNNCTGVLFLSVPGTYMLELNDPKHLGNFLAFAEEMDAGVIPDGLLIGNCACDYYVGTNAQHTPQ